MVVLEPRDATTVQLSWIPTPQCVQAMGRMADLSVRRFDPCIPRVTGFSGVCRAHFALVLPDMRRLRHVQN